MSTLGLAHCISCSPFITRHWLSKPVIVFDDIHICEVTVGKVLTESMIGSICKSGLRIIALCNERATAYI